MMAAQATELLTSRFRLRPLEVDDVSERYAGWLRNPVAQRFIAAAASAPDLAALRQYVSERSGREDVLFLGIFDRATGSHLGNIKYEPVDSTAGYAIMGILVGEPEWRGKGVAAEVLAASAHWLRKHRNIRQIVLGVQRSNVEAIRAYRKVGFKDEATPFIPTVSPENLAMVWHLA